MLKRLLKTTRYATPIIASTTICACASAIYLWKSKNEDHHHEALLGRYGSENKDIGQSVESLSNNQNTKPDQRYLWSLDSNQHSDQQSNESEKGHSHSEQTLQHRKDHLLTMQDGVGQQNKKTGQDSKQIINPTNKTHKGRRVTKIKPYTSIESLPEFPLDSKLPDDQFAVVVIDMPYTPKFSQEIINRINNVVKSRKSNEQLKVYRLDVTKPGVSQRLERVHGANLQEQTIILMKNPYEDQNKMINFDFDMYIRYPELVSVYLSDLNIISRSNFEEKYSEKIKKMSPTETLLLLVADVEDPQELAKKKLTAKYMEMQLGLHSLTGVKICLIDEQLAKSAGFLESPKKNSLHLLKKHNEFTYAEPNRWLFGGIPYHVIENITLHDQHRKISVPKHLSTIETFNSTQIDAPYLCSITIDRNKIHPQEERQVLRVFNELKRKQVFPYLSYVLRFAEIEYPGKQQQNFHNRKWMVKVGKLDDIDRQLMVHDAQTRQDLQKINIDEKQWQTNTFEYLFRYPEINEESLTKFIKDILEDKQPPFYKSEKPYRLQNLHKLNAENFNESVLKQKDKSHLVFEYSDHCASCQILSPLIEYTADIFHMFPDLRISVHKLNCDRNRVKGQPYSPYTPNLYYYSRKWGNQWPLRYPLLESINDHGIKGIYQFCEITESLGQVSQPNLQKHIQAVKQANIRLQHFV